MIEFMEETSPDWLRGRAWDRVEPGVMFAATVSQLDDGAFVAFATVTRIAGEDVDSDARRSMRSNADFTDAQIDKLMVDATVEALGPVGLMRLLRAWAKDGPPAP